MELTKVFQVALLLAVPWTLSMHQIIETGRSLEQVEKSTHDTKDTEREHPDPDNCDDGRLASDEPAKDTK